MKTTKWAKMAFIERQQNAFHDETHSPYPFLVSQWASVPGRDRRIR